MMLGLVLGVAFCALAVVAVLAAVLLPGANTSPRLGIGIRQRALDATDRTLRQRGVNSRMADELELAGIGRSPASVTLTIAVAMIIAFAGGAAIAVVRPGPIAWLLPIALAGFVLLVARFVITRRITKRRAAFAEQLDDSLQLVSSGLRAGHSLVRSVDAVSQEAESPIAEEFARVVNEHRLGRDLGEALENCALRMQSDDLAWAAQAVAVHREVGGNLSEVLDHVGDTIRERNQIRRQIATLSAEGRISANVLIGLPIVLAAVLSVISPSYLTVFVTTPLGLAMIGGCLVLFVLGVVWLRGVVKIAF